VLRQIKRRTIAHLRGQVAPVPREVLGRFLPSWHRVSARDPHERLEDAIVQLEGLPLSYRELVRMILPARVRGFRQEQLDELGATRLAGLGRPFAAPRRRRPRHAVPPRARAAAAAARGDDRRRQLIDGFDDRHRRILEHLDAARRVVSRRTDVGERRRRQAADTVLDALWDLVWAGLVTNDTFAALRHRSDRRRRRADAARRRQ
jgi:ATP-dependent helicase Lhr and Lhr-like helicase